MEKVFRFYSEATKPTRVTVVGQVENGVTKIAVARSSEQDNFIRKKGRMIAEGRLAKGKLFKTVPIAVQRSEEFVEIALQVVKEVEQIHEQYKQNKRKEK